MLCWDALFIVEKKGVKVAEILPEGGAFIWYPFVGCERTLSWGDINMFMLQSGVV